MRAWHPLRLARTRGRSVDCAALVAFPNLDLHIPDKVWAVSCIVRLKALLHMPEFADELRHPSSELARPRREHHVTILLEPGEHRDRFVDGNVHLAGEVDGGVPGMEDAGTSHTRRLSVSSSR